MEKKNKLYKNIGIHVISSLFTVDKGVIKVLLIKRNNEPFKGQWALPSGALYNNELLSVGANRELKEKTGLTNIALEQIGIFDKIDRSSLMRMIGVSFLGVISIERVKLEKVTSKTIDADYFPIEKIPTNLAYDHNEIVNHALNVLKEKITTTNILVNLFPNNFTLPELQKVYEAIFNRKIDRRNFRKKLIGLNLIEDTNKTIKFEGKKPAKLYKFKNKKENKNIF